MILGRESSKRVSQKSLKGLQSLKVLYLMIGADIRGADKWCILLVCYLGYHMNMGIDEMMKRKCE